MSFPSFSNDSLFLGGLPGPRLLLGGGIDDERLDDEDGGFSSIRAGQGEAFLLPPEEGTDDTAGGVTSDVASLLSPFFFLVVNVLGLSSVYIVVGVRCRLGLLRLVMAAGGITFTT